MMSQTTGSPITSLQPSFQRYGSLIVFADNGGTQENCRKKRSKLAHATIGANPSSSSKPKPGRKRDQGAPKITRPCSECGKQFWSWKALFGHMRCHPERQWRGINLPPKFRRHPSPENPVEDLGSHMTEEDHGVATCLIMLANGFNAVDTSMNGEMDEVGPSGSGCRFECSSCKKVFGSHQALGGHRASHKNVKGCFAMTRNESEEEDEDMMVMVLGHKCCVCLKVFSSGQALGGHKRCHWEKGDDSLSRPGLDPYMCREGCWGCDLNLPAPIDNNEDSSSSSSELGLDLRLGI